VPSPPSQAWYRRAGWEGMGYESVEDYLVPYWEAMYLRANASDLVAQLRAWQACDVGEATGAGYAAAMRSISSRAVLMPCRTDVNFIDRELGRLLEDA
jgi:homoserine O-acetyltransferase